MFEIGRSKRAQQAFAFDDIAIVPSRRTRGEEQVNLTWRIDAFTFDFPLIAAPMDSVMSPATAIEMGRLGGLGVLNLEGLWTRYDDPEPLLRGDRRHRRPGRGDPADAGDLRRADQGGADRQAGRRDPAGRGPGRRRAVAAEHPGVRRRGRRRSGVDFFVIRGTTVSAEHVAGDAEPLNLKQFIYALDVPVIVGGCATYQAALHLMRTGAAGVLVGFGGGAAHTTRDVLGRGGADGLGGLRRGRRAAGLPGRVRRPVRARHRRRLGRPLR